MIDIMAGWAMPAKDWRWWVHGRVSRWAFMVRICGFYIGGRIVWRA